jgi:hypothetical protein
MTGGRRARLGGRPHGRRVRAAVSVSAVAVASWLAVAAPGRAFAADDRPSENDLFGGGASPTGGAAGAAPKAAGADGAGGTAVQAPPILMPTAPIPAAPAPTTGPPDPGSANTRDAALLGDPNAATRLSQDVAPEDPLKIGGQIYLRANYANPGKISVTTTVTSTDSTGQPTTAPTTMQRQTTVSAPSLVDAYFDARPNDRVRGFVLGRMFFDPTLPSASQMMSTSTMTGTMAGGTGTTFSTQTPLLSGVSTVRGPTTVLDQLWLRFDILNTVFVTAGRQHVKWGTWRFWTPTDYLHPVHVNPVAVFDARPGYTMLKLQVPIEKLGWNFYAFALAEGVSRWQQSSMSFPAGSDTTATLGQVGGAARAEFVWGPAELGLDTVLYHDRNARYGADLSFGIGDFDLYADAGFENGSDIPRVSLIAGTTTDYTTYFSNGIKPQVVGGGTYSLKYNDNDVFTLAGEYFYNSRGYSDPHDYPGLFTKGLFEFFYTGRHYAALSAVMLAPWSWNRTNFTFTTLGNLSDQSFISRLDYSHTVLTHITFEAFGAVNYGRREGEFRLGVDNLTLPATTSAMGVTPATTTTQTVSLEPQAFTLGVGLRISI